MEKNKIQLRNNSIDTGLESLTEFLNFKFDSDGADEHERLKQKYALERLASTPWQWEYDTKTVKKAEKIQKEILGILIPIVPPARADSAFEAHDRTEQLLWQVNKYKFGIVWQVNRTDNTLEVVNPQVVVSTERQLNILGHRCVINRYFIPDIRFEFSVDVLYLIILIALEKGQFTRLKRCQWGECQRFFVANPPSMKACNKEDAKAIDTKEASRRVTEGRKEEREEKQRRSWPAKERKGILYFLNILKLTRKGKLWVKEETGRVVKQWRRGKFEYGERLQKRKDLTNAFYRWQNGDSLNEIWGELPDESKEVFIGYAERKGYKAL